MPTIAQQDYIYIPILDDGEVIDAIPQDVQNRLFLLAKDGRALDVVFCDVNKGINGIYARPISFNLLSNAVIYYYWDLTNAEMATVSCIFSEGGDDPEPGPKDDGGGTK